MGLRLTKADVEFLYSVAAEMFPEGKVPAWISKHPSIRDREIKKVFPSFGLNNFEEPADIPIQDLFNSNPQHATGALYAIREEIVGVVYLINQEVDKYARAEVEKIDAELKRKIESLPLFSKERAELTGLLWRPKVLFTQEVKDRIRRGEKTLLAFLNQLETFVDTSCIENLPDGRIKFILRQQVSFGDKPVGLVGENLPRVYGKAKKIVDEYFASIGSDVRLRGLDNIPAIKIFNSRNIPLNGGVMNVVFSATGQKGAWDIATMSMRGISSCQTWEVGKDPTEYNACVIGSVASNYVGIIYLTTGKDYEGMGPRMIKRCIVRFGVDMAKPKKERVPVIILDAMHDSYSPGVAKVFVNALQKRTKFKVVDLSGRSGNRDVQIPNETLPKIVDQEEDIQPGMGFKSYQDNQLKEINKRVVKEKDGTHEDPKLLERVRLMRSHNALESINSSVGNSWLNMSEKFFENFSEKEKNFYHQISEFYYLKIDHLYETTLRNNDVLNKSPKFVKRYFIKKYLKLLSQITEEFQAHKEQHEMISKIVGYLEPEATKMLAKD